MARSTNKNRKARGLNKLQEQGFLACAAGVAMLVFPLVAGNSPVLSALANAAGRFGGWVAAVGALMLGVHHFAKKSQSALQAGAASEASSTESPSGARLLKARARTPERTEPKWSDSSKTTLAPDVSLALEPNHAHSPYSFWSADVFSAIEWRRFEAVCEALFAQAGFETRSQPHGADGGVDIWLHSRNSTGAGAVAVVQCKHWQGKPVGVKEMREFFGVVASNQLKRGTYATTSTYTPDALQFAQANGINALDGAGMLKLIASRTPEQQQALLDVAF